MTTTSSELLLRIERRIVVSPDTDCWEWQGAISPSGYGQIRVRPKLWYTHRLAYVLHVGEIPVGLQLDHLCRNRRCCNPQHLEPVTSRENGLRGDGPQLQRLRHAAVTHCPQGHEYTDTNTYRSRAGTRACIACTRSRTRAWRASRRAAHQ